MEVLFCGICLKKSEPILRRTQTNEMELMRTRRGKLFLWEYEFAPPRLSSRSQKGSREECGRVSRWIQNLFRRQLTFNSFSCQINNTFWIYNSQTFFIYHQTIFYNFCDFLSLKIWIYL